MTDDQSQPTLSAAEREAIVLRYWRRGEVTPLGVANALVRGRVMAEDKRSAA